MIPPDKAPTLSSTRRESPMQRNDRPGAHATHEDSRNTAICAAIHGGRQQSCCTTTDRRSSGPGGIAGSTGSIGSAASASMTSTSIPPRKAPHLPLSQLDVRPGPTAPGEEATPSAETGGRSHETGPEDVSLPSWRRPGESDRRPGPFTPPGSPAPDAAAHTTAHGTASGLKHRRGFRRNRGRQQYVTRTLAALILPFVHAPRCPRNDPMSPVFRVRTNAVHRRTPNGKEL